MVKIMIFGSIFFKIKVLGLSTSPRKNLAFFIRKNMMSVSVLKQLLLNSAQPHLFRLGSLWQNFVQSFGPKPLSPNTGTGFPIVDETIA